MASLQDLQRSLFSSWRCSSSEAALATNAVATKVTQQSATGEHTLNGLGI